MEAIIRKCTCNHEFQDNEYGKGMRLFTVGDKSGEAKCTVCGKKIRK